MRSTSSPPRFGANDHSALSQLVEHMKILVQRESDGSEVVDNRATFFDGINTGHPSPRKQVEEKFPKEKFRVFSEMRGKNR